MIPPLLNVSYQKNVSIGGSGAASRCDWVQRHAAKGTCRNTSLKLYLNEFNAEAQRCSSGSFKILRHKDAHRKVAYLSLGCHSSLPKMKSSKSITISFIVTPPDFIVTVYSGEDRIMTSTENFYIFYHYIGCLLRTEPRAVDAQVIVFGSAPFLS